MNDQIRAKEIKSVPNHKDLHHIRWFIRRDVPEVLEIEGLSFEFPWIESDFTEELQNRNSIGMVVESEDKVVAYMIYRLHKNKLEVVNFAVHPENRRSGIGSKMMNKLINKLTSQRRSSIEVECDDAKTGMHLFLRSKGFRCSKIRRNVFVDSEGIKRDNYQFEFLVNDPYTHES